MATSSLPAWAKGRHDDSRGNVQSFADLSFGSSDDIDHAHAMEAAAFSEAQAMRRSLDGHTKPSDRAASEPPSPLSPLAVPAFSWQRQSPSAHDASDEFREDYRDGDSLNLDDSYGSFGRGRSEAGRDLANFASMSGGRPRGHGASVAEGGASEKATVAPVKTVPAGTSHSEVAHAVSPPAAAPVKTAPPAGSQSSFRDASPKPGQGSDTSPSPPPQAKSSDVKIGDESSSSSLLLARARAGVGFAGQTNLLSVDDLFASSDDDKEDVSDSHAEDALPREGGVARRVGFGDGEPRLYRSEHANVREPDARLHWPPRPTDVLEDSPEARYVQEAWTAQRPRRKRLDRRGVALDATRAFDLQLEEQLTHLVVLLTLDAAAVGL